jgi:hypothetical protein
VATTYTHGDRFHEINEPAAPVVLARRARGSTRVCTASQVRNAVRARPRIHAGSHIPPAVQMARIALQIRAFVARRSVVFMRVPKIAQR